MGKIAYRRVAPDWEHPKEMHNGKEVYKPLRDGTKYFVELADWEIEKNTFDRQYPALRGTEEGLKKYESLYGEKPNPDHYTPFWEPEKATAWQVYEEVTEGTPITKVYPDLDTMAREIAAEHGHSFEAMRKKILATVEEGLWYVPVSKFEEGGEYANYGEKPAA